ncbi:hypothetical protein CWC39_01205 [Corynebacterium heidelbergense]|uniref:Uncharacterized protein n=1 Tax=Corynebacterium heidelbergense TaxID=2055947 RepID=A0A364VDU6_9CORY|nr:hypothetical protein CWC39_01205 [Corynebacterium heidelbergense]
MSDHWLRVLQLAQHISVCISGLEVARWEVRAVFGAELGVIGSKFAAGVFPILLGYFCSMFFS